VSRVGGLADTVIDIDEHPDIGTGLLCDPTIASLRSSLVRALRLFSDRPRYLAAQRHGMARDFSWKAASAGYERLYQEAL
jgi:starch synthase